MGFCVLFIIIIISVCYGGCILCRVLIGFVIDVYRMIGYEFGREYVRLDLRSWGRGVWVLKLVVRCNFVFIIWLLYDLELVDFLGLGFFIFKI